MGGDSAKTMCKFINIQQSTKTCLHTAKQIATCKFINIQQSTKTYTIIMKFCQLCKFINIQQSTKTSGMGLLCKGSVSLSISNRVLKHSIVVDVLYYV